MKIKKLITLLLLVLFVNKFVYSFEGYDPRINLLPGHERIKALDRYWQMRQWQDRQQAFFERHLNKIDLSESLLKRDPERYEKNLRLYAAKLDELRRNNPLPSFIPLSEREQEWFKIEGWRGELIKQADNIRSTAEKLKKEMENNFWNNYVTKTIITAAVVIAAVAATALTGGTAAPVTTVVIKSAVTSWAVDTAHSGYLMYNVQNRGAYDALRWSQSEEFKVSFSVATVAKIATNYAVTGSNPISFGDGSGSWNFGDVYYSMKSVTTIASIGTPYYNKDINRTLAYMDAALNIWSGFRDLTLEDKSIESMRQNIDEFQNISANIDQFKDTSYASLYNDPKKWVDIAETMKEIGALAKITSGIYSTIEIDKPDIANTEAKRGIQSTFAVMDVVSRSCTYNALVQSKNSLVDATRNHLEFLERNHGAYVRIFEKDYNDPSNRLGVKFLRPTEAVDYFVNLHSTNEKDPDVNYLNSAYKVLKWMETPGRYLTFDDVSNAITRNVILSNPLLGILDRDALIRAGIKKLYLDSKLNLDMAVTSYNGDIVVRNKADNSYSYYYDNRVSPLVNSDRSYLNNLGFNTSNLNFNTSFNSSNLNFNMNNLNSYNFQSFKR